jgi:hypothetical protein
VLWLIHQQRQSPDQKCLLFEAEKCAIGTSAAAAAAVAAPAACVCMLLASRSSHCFAAVLQANITACTFSFNRAKQSGAGVLVSDNAKVRGGGHSTCTPVRALACAHVIHNQSSNFLCVQHIAAGSWHQVSRDDMPTAQQWHYGCPWA